MGRLEEILVYKNAPNKWRNNVALFLNKVKPRHPHYSFKFEILHSPEVRVVE